MEIPRKRFRFFSAALAAQNRPKNGNKRKDLHFAAQLIYSTTNF